VRLVAEGRVATLCIHGDDRRAVANAELVRLVLKNHGIAVRSFMETTC
jgi:lactam utilization protein B